MAFSVKDRRFALFATVIRALLLLFAVIPGAYAHGGGRGGDWSSWAITPGVTLLTVLTAAVYVRGARARPSAGTRVSPVRQMSFLLGLFLVWLAIQSPLDVLAERLFFIHQVQHIVLRMIGPILIILGMPLPAMLRGFPAFLKGKTVTPLVRSAAIQRLYAFLIHPFVAPVLFVATLFVWQLPSLQNLSLENRTLHDAMHISLLTTGLFFWWLILDPRPQAARLSNGLKILVLAGIIVPNSLLGAFIFLQEDVLYAGYDQLAGAWGMSALADQQWGGLIMWIPGSMMSVVIALVILRRWLHEQPKKPGPRVTV